MRMNQDKGYGDVINLTGETEEAENKERVGYTLTDQWGGGWRAREDKHG